MIKITLKIDGMMCAMCESHVNDAIRRNFQIKKVTSSHTKNTTEIIAQSDISDVEIEHALQETGYRLLESSREPYEKKGLFSSLFGH